MSETTKVSRRWYAAQSPRGFGNEINVYSFASRKLRDAWVEAHEDDGDVNSAHCGARSITAREARQICGYRGDAITQSYNSTEPINMDGVCRLDEDGDLIED